MLSLTRRGTLFAAALALGACHSQGKQDTADPGSGNVAIAAMAANVPACGNAGLPDCPLQRWMKATLQTYQRSGDYERMGRSFSELAAHAPDGYDDWKALSERGAELAAKHDANAIKQVCKDCHQSQRARYRRELRNTPAW